MNRNSELNNEDDELNYGNDKWINEATVLNEKIMEITENYYELAKYESKIRLVIENVLACGTTIRSLRITLMTMFLLSRAILHRQVIFGRGWNNAIGAAVFFKVLEFNPKYNEEILKDIIVNTLGITKSSLESAIESFRIFLRDEPFLLTKIPRRIKLKKDEKLCRPANRQYMKYFVI